jgi:hypothetical protein
MALTQTCPLSYIPLTYGEQIPLYLEVIVHCAEPAVGIEAGAATQTHTHTHTTVSNVAAATHSQRSVHIKRRKRHIHFCLF